MTVAPLPDAAPENWVDRRAPERLKPWLKLGRFDRPVGIWLLMLPGWAGIALASSMAGRLPDPWLLLAFAVGAALMRAAGCAFNDVVDRDVDRKVARTAGRPVASGAISVKQAWAFLIACSLVSFAVLLTLGPVAIGLGSASCALVAAYPFMKRITWWPQAWLGLTFNWGVLMGFAAATAWAGAAASLSAWVAPGLLYAALVFWTLGYDTIYAIQDLEDDALAGIKSSALRLGRRAPIGVAAFYATAQALALAAVAAADLGLLAWFGVLAFGTHLLLQAAKLRLDDPRLALALFKSNRNAGLILVAGLVAGAWKG
jgi:4-hydroxybenzoate polyprenyltransferase